MISLRFHERGYGLVALSKDHPARAGVAAPDAFAVLMRRVERDAADCDFELFLDLRLGLDGAIPVRGCEAAVDLGLVFLV